MSNAAEKLPLIERTKAAALERNRARLAELLGVVHRKMTAVVEGFYDVGEALREVLDKKLYAAAGHATFEAMLEAEGLMSPRQARKLIAVARKVPREQALGLGHERAYALLAYAEATAANDTVAAIVTSGVLVGGKPAAEASLREITAATRQVRAKAQGAKPKTEAQRERERADAAVTRAVREALRAAGFGRAAVAVAGDEVRVVLSRAQAERLVG
ncbi:MAG: hypothetical protein U0324_08750 [Polyangiales bacterium]